MNVGLPATPQAFRGVWQRTLYAEPAKAPYQQADTTTQVYWIQGKHWHADLRLPADSPDFSGITGLDDCNRRQLEWLARLTAFAGITQIDSELGVCTWHRYQDLCPSLEKDVGLLRWIDGTILEERHPHDQYVEHWQQLSNDAVEDVIQDAEGQLRWLQIGDHAMAITPRPWADNADALFAPINSLTDSALLWRASLCFDYLERSQDGWRVVLSTQPWRKGVIYDSAANRLHSSLVTPI
jgi:hypothetical protein